MKNYLNLENFNNHEKIKEAAKVLENGGVVIFPTETVYGIGVNGLDEKAIRKLYEIKERPYDKPISLLVADFEMIKEVAENISDVEWKIISKFFPGPITIILNKKKCVPDILTNNKDKVGIRMPQNQTAIELIKCLGKPIATSSANISGKRDNTNLKDILVDFKDKVDYYIDEGKSKIGIASTVVQVIDGKPIILREGIITKEELEKIIKIKPKK